MNSSWHIRGARIVDPSTGKDEVKDLVIEEGIISGSVSIRPGTLTEIDARGLVLLPGFIDMHVHFREPGDTDAETIATGSAAAARGGFVTVVTMPNTKPPTDSPELIRRTIDAGATAGKVRILPSACITQAGRGSAAADLGALADAGAVAFTDDGSTVRDDALLEKAMMKAAELGIPILDHALDPELAGKGVVRRGPASEHLNVPGIPPIAETRIVERDIRLAAKTGCHMHIQHISAAETVRMIARAREKGLRISGEATPHHITLTDADVPAGNANYKMNPPLGSESDREAIIAGLCDGSITVLATDHAPHTATAKNRGLIEAPFGVVGLETAIGLTYSVLVQPRRMDLMKWASLWTTGPASVLGLAPPSLEPGGPADITVFDPGAEWVIRSEDFLSRSRNTPFEQRRVTGKPIFTLYAGCMTWNGR